MPIFKFEKLGRRDRGLDVTVQGRPKSFRRGADSSKISFKSFPSRTTGPTWKPPSYYSVPESDEDDVIAAAMRGGINRATKTHINNVTKHGMDVSIHPSILRIQKAREDSHAEKWRSKQSRGLGPCVFSVGTHTPTHKSTGQPRDY